MSGLEVIGGISAVIGIIDACVKIWESVQKDLKFSEAFKTVARRLPILEDIFRTCKTQLEPVKNTLPADAVRSLTSTIENCKGNAKRLREIFEETIPGEDDAWQKRYFKVVQRLGKGGKVEELMRSISEDAQNLVNYHAVKSAKPELCAQLEEIIKEMKAVEPSIPSNEGCSNVFNAYGGTQNIQTGEG